MKQETLTPLMCAEIDVKRTIGRRQRAAAAPRPTTEGDIMRLIMIELSAAGHFVERIQSGLLYTKDARPVRIGFPGRSDLSGARAGDGRAFFMEVKTATGRPTKEQQQFIAAMQKRGLIAGVVRSVDEAVKLLSM